MPLQPGARLGPYEVLSALGAGGMGEVYRARDTRLDRTVAIKVLPPHLAADRQFRDRFDREARAVAALNHPHICTLYDIGSQDGTDFLVMEYLEGETLAACLEKGALPLDQALTIAIQIASALDKAHRVGITHRDLKPGNIMLTKSGAKLLDFGLAKSSAAVVAGAGPSMLPTTPPNLTAQGTILGTFQYMAPEQLEGQEADPRTDIFAFGSVLYEMLTGRAAFTGKSQASLIGSILRDQPEPLRETQPVAPPGLERVVAVCLAKDRDDRWQTARDLLRELKWVAEGLAPAGSAPALPGTSAQKGRAVIPWGVAAAMTVVTALALAWPQLRPGSQASAPTTRFEIQIPTTHDLYRGGGAELALSPDGRSVIYVGISAAGRVLYRRPLDQLVPVVIPGSEGRVTHPVPSPDGSSLAFGRNSQLMLIGATDRMPMTITDGWDQLGITWADDDSLIFGFTGIPGTSRLSKVPAAGGVPAALTNPDALPNTSSRLPQMLPGGSVLVYTLWSGSLESAKVVARSLTTAVERTLFEGTNPRLTTTGHLLFVRDSAIWAVAFNSEILQAIGAPVRVVENVQVNGGGLGLFAVSANGTLAYVTGDTGTQRTLVWVDRNGREELVNTPPREYLQPRISPDGLRVALTARDAATPNEDIWVWDTVRSALTRLTSEPATDTAPTWTPDGRRLVFGSTRGGAMHLFRQAADGAQGAERLTESESPQLPQAFAANGALIVQENAPKGGTRLSALLLGASRDVRVLLESPFVLVNAEVSPNGSWLAYQSNESGPFEIYVRPYPNVNDQRWQVSADGGVEPAWSRDSRELFYQSTDGRLMSVPVQTGNGFVAGQATQVLAARYFTNVARRQYDVSPDGQRFLMLKEGGGKIVVVQNWFEELKRLVPTTR